MSFKTTEPGRPHTGLLELIPAMKYAGFDVAEIFVGSMSPRIRNTSVGPWTGGVMVFPDLSA